MADAADADADVFSDVELEVQPGQPWGPLACAVCRTPTPLRCATCKTPICHQHDCPRGCDATALN